MSASDTKQVCDQAISKRVTQTMRSKAKNAEVTVDNVSPLARALSGPEPGAIRTVSTESVAGNGLYISFHALGWSRSEGRRARAEGA